MAKGSRGSGVMRGRNLFPLSPRDAPRVRTILDAIRANPRVRNAALATRLRLRSRTVIRLNSLANLHYPAEYGLREPQGGRWGAQTSLTNIAARKERVREAVLAGEDVSKLGLDRAKLRQILFELRRDGAIPSGTRRVSAKASGPHAEIVVTEYQARMRLVARALLRQPRTPTLLRRTLSRRAPQGATTREAAAVKWALRRRIETALKGSSAAVVEKRRRLATYLGIDEGRVVDLARRFRLLA